MPTTVTELMFWGMTAVIGIGVTVIGYLLHNGFSSVQEQLKAIKEALSLEHGEREKLSAEIRAMQRVCDERHSIPQRRISDCP